jgi:hypothetical protein
MFVLSVPSRKISLLLKDTVSIVGGLWQMPGRETEYERGYIRGVSSMMSLLTSDTVKKLDKSNVLRYAQQLVEEMKEERR